MATGQISGEYKNPNRQKRKNLPQQVFIMARN
jgi:hypothetical protein